MRTAFVEIFKSDISAECCHKSQLLFIHNSGVHIFGRRSLSGGHDFALFTRAVISFCSSSPKKYTFVKCQTATNPSIRQYRAIQAHRSWQFSWSAKSHASEIVSQIIIRGRFHVAAINEFLWLNTSKWTDLELGMGAFAGGIWMSNSRRARGRAVLLFGCHQWQRARSAPITRWSYDGRWPCKLPK